MNAAVAVALLLILIIAAKLYVTSTERRADRGAAAAEGGRARADVADTDRQVAERAPSEETPVAFNAPTGSSLSGMPAIRHFFRTNETPVYFVSATAFNLLGIDRWVRNFRFVNYYDSFDGGHPNVIVPKEQTPRAFGSIEEIVNYLLGHKEIGDAVRSRGGGKAAFLMFDEETEELASELGLDVAFPPASLRHRLDSKIETTRLGNEAGVPSVPNTMGEGTTYEELLRLSRDAGLGDDLVIQTPYGDSGQTTFFVATERDWLEHRDAMVGEQLKVMRRIEPRELAIEGVITRHGTLGGPADGGARRVRRAHAVRRGLVRRRRLPAAAHGGAARGRAGAHDRDGGSPAAGGLPGLLRAGLPPRCRHRATSGWGSSTHV